MFPAYAGPQPRTMEELQAMMQPGGALSQYAKPAMPAIPQAAQYITAQEVQSMIDASLARTVTAVQSPLAQFDGIFQRALPAADFEAFTRYVQSGAPGFGDLLKTDKLDPIAQLLWETIKENVK